MHYFNILKKKSIHFNNVIFEYKNYFNYLITLISHKQYKILIEKTTNKLNQTKSKKHQCIGIKNIGLIFNFPFIKISMFTQIRVKTNNVNKE